MLLNHVALVLLLTLAVRSVSSFIFPDEVSSRYNTAHNNNNNHRRPSGHGGHFHASNGGGFVPGGFGNNYDNRPVRPADYGGIVSHSTGSESFANSQSGSQDFGGFSQSAAQSQSQSQSQGYQPQLSYNPFGSSASSASSAASATSGIVNGVAVASAAAAAASAGSGNGGAGSASSASSASSSSSGFAGGYDTGLNQIPSWYFRNRIGEETANSVAASYSADSSSGGGLNEATIVFSA